MKLQPAVYLATVHEHIITYCRCSDAVKLFRFLLSEYSNILQLTAGVASRPVQVPVVSAHPDRGLQQCAELHFSLTGRDGWGSCKCYILF
jgi:hypothetical protein